jgi:protein-S-isoprenylcysteine O-methyltransferase Ste14
MTRAKWALLIFELALFAVILILPQVDLPDFTFHRGTAPVVARARVSAAPVLSGLALGPLLVVPVSIRMSGPASLQMQTSPRSAARLSLLCVLIC